METTCHSKHKNVVDHNQKILFCSDIKINEVILLNEQRKNTYLPLKNNVQKEERRQAQFDYIIHL